MQSSAWSAARHERFKSIVKSSLASAPISVASVLVQKPAGRSLGLRVLLTPQPTNGATIIHVDPHGIAWRAKLRPGDRILSVLHDGKEHLICDGHAATTLIPSTIGELTLRVKQQRWTSKDHAAARIAAGWAGYKDRTVLLQGLFSQATGGGHSFDASLPLCIRSPPRLSEWDVYEDD